MSRPLIFIRYKVRPYFHTFNLYPGFSFGLHLDGGARLNFWVWNWVFGIAIEDTMPWIAKQKQMFK